MQPQTIQVTDLDKEEELQGTKTELLNQLVALVGLTYEQFTRTVLLAQNDFATFLKSRESAKAELLEKLTVRKSIRVSPGRFMPVVRRLTKR